MTAELQNQAFVFLQSFLFGMLLDIIYEFFYSFGLVLCITLSRSKNKRLSSYINKQVLSKKRKIIINIWDFLFFLFISPICAIFVFGVNSGIVRWYIILGAALGFMALKLTVGKYIGRMLDTVVSVLQIVLKYKVFIPMKISLIKHCKRKKRIKKEKGTKVVLLSINNKQG